MRAEEIFDRYGLEYETVSMAAHTTFGIGGEALMAELSADKAGVIAALEDEGIFFDVIGRGSNLLVADERIEKVFLHIGRLMADIEVNDCTIRCGAGAPLSAVCTRARDLSLTGLEFAYGIPASVGGAVYMNAGAYGGEIRDVLVSADIVSHDKIIRMSADELGLSYRHSRLMDEPLYCIGAEFRLGHGDREQINAEMEELMARRREKQPLEYKSAGSAFKRPQGAYAAALIEQCGLKGYTVGGAQVSTKHSGFVVNTGGATFKDVMAVMEHVQRTVRDMTGYELEIEPEIVR